MQRKISKLTIPVVYHKHKGKVLNGCFLKEKSYDFKSVQFAYLSLACYELRVLVGKYVTPSRFSAFS